MLRGMRESVAARGDSTQLAAGAADLARTLAALRQALEAPDGAPGMPGLLEFNGSDPALDEDGYLFAWEGRLLMVPILPHKDPGALNQVARPLEVAREILEELRPRYPDLAIALSGRPVIYSDEMASTSRDMTRATLLALACVALVFVVAFRSAVRPLLAVAALTLALCWTVGATTLLIGHLNIFAMVFAVVLVGLGIDFGIHLLSQYRNALGHGLSVREALVEVYSEVGMGTILGALTTATALSTAALTDFLGLAELGLICGMGIILCLAAMLVVFPALLVLVDARRAGEGDPALRAASRGPEARPALPARPAWAWATGALVLLCVAAAVFNAGRGWVPFEYNLMELNDPSSRALDWEGCRSRRT
jgi:predicted exporter